MDPQNLKRKLTAVFSTDVVGYSRLMGEDEVATVETEAYKQVIFYFIKARASLDPDGMHTVLL